MDIREKLVELLKRTEYQFTQTHSLTVENVAYDLFINGVTVQEWISVEDRLPTKEDAKIMGGYLLAIQNGKKPNVWKWTEVAKYPECFTYWYSLPQPPKGE